MVLQIVSTLATVLVTINAQALPSFVSFGGSADVYRLAPASTYQALPQVYNQQQQYTQAVVPQVAYASVPAVPAAYTPAVVSPAAYTPAVVSPAAYSPAVASPAAYSPAVVAKAADYTYVPTTKYETNPLPLNVPADQLVYNALEEVRKQGEVISTVTDKLGNNKLIVSLFTNKDDPCAMDIATFSPTVRKLVNAVIASQAELTELVAAAQAIKANEKDSAAVIRTSLDSIKLIEPLGPRFSSVFETKPGCTATLQSASKDLGKISTVVGAVSKTNLFTSDPAVKANLGRIADLTNSVSVTTSKLDEQKFGSLCSGSPTFNRDVLSGVSEIVTGFSDLISKFGGEAADAKKLQESAQLLSEGATLINDLDFTAEGDASPVPSSGPQCQTSLASVTSALSEVADLVELVGPQFENL